MRELAKGAGAFPNMGVVLQEEVKHVVEIRLGEAIDKVQCRQKDG